MLRSQLRTGPRNDDDSSWLTNRSSSNTRAPGPNLEHIIITRVIKTIWGGERQNSDSVAFT